MGKEFFGGLGGSAKYKFFSGAAAYITMHRPITKWYLLNGVC